MLQALPSPDALAYDVFVASGQRVYSAAVPRAGAFAGERGKEGMYIAEAAGEVAAAPLDACQHRAEVQHLGLYEDGAGGTVLASADCYGRAVVAQLRRLEGQAGLQVVGVQQLQPPDLLR